MAEVRKGLKVERPLAVLAPDTLWVSTDEPEGQDKSWSNGLVWVDVADPFAVLEVGPQGPTGDKGPVGDKGPTGDPGGSGSVAWADVQNKPTEFPPASHTHAELPTPGQKNALQGTQGTPGATNQYVTTQDARLSDARAPTAHTHPWAEVTGQPASYPPSAHTHPVSEITGLETVGKLTADQASTATALTNTTGLSFAVTSGLTYRFAAVVVYRTAVLTTGIRLGATTPAFTVYSANVTINGIAVDGTGAAFHGALTTSGDSVVSPSVAAINTDYVATITGVLVPSANGTFQLQHASEVAATVATVRAGSHIAYRAV